jgi:MarR family transcriptional regulator for hemolysin
MLQYDFEQSVGFWTIMAARAFERAMNGEIAPRGITWRQCQVLGWLALCGDVSQTELAERMMVEGPTLVGILDRMERDGWITRHDHPADRRKKIIRPTDRAEPVWAEISDCARRVRTQAIEGLSKDDLATLRRILNRIETNLRDPAGHSSVTAPAEMAVARN